MNDIYQKAYTLYKTELFFSHSRMVKLYLFLAGFSIIVFGFIGVISNINSISSKVLKYQEMKSQESRLVEKSAILREYEDFFADNANAVSTVYKMLPDSENTSEFIVEAVTAGGDSGFSVTNANFAKSPGNLSISVTLSGQGSKAKLSEFIDRLENLNRIAKVTKVNISQNSVIDEDVYGFIVQLEIFLSKEVS